jgi:hypothetical protein
MWKEVFQECCESIMQGSHIVQLRLHGYKKKLTCPHIITGAETPVVQGPADRESV